MLKIYLLIIALGADAGSTTVLGPNARNLSYGGLHGNANGVGVCGDGYESEWLPQSSRASDNLSEFATEFYLPDTNDRITLTFAAAPAAPAYFQLQYCVLEDIARLKEECFFPLDIVSNDATGFVDLATPTIGFLPEHNCAMSHDAEGGGMQATWLLPSDMAKGKHIVYRWMLYEGTSCCPHPSICGANIPNSVKEYTYTDSKGWANTAEPIELTGHACMLNWSDTMTTECTSRIPAVKTKNCIDGFRLTEANEYSTATKTSYGIEYSFVAPEDYWAVYLKGSMSAAVCRQFPDNDVSQLCLRLIQGQYSDTFKGRAPTNRSVSLDYAKYCFESGQKHASHCLANYFSAIN